MTVSSRLSFASALVALALTLSTARGRAESLGPREFGIGFVDTDAPLGGRWWFTHDVGVDLNFGFTSNAFDGIHFDHAVAQIGIPIALHRWDRLAAQIRPGFEVRADQVPAALSPSSGYYKATTHDYRASIMLEAEVMVVDHLGLSGNFGVAWTRQHIDFNGPVDLTTWSTVGGDFSQVGFHLYFGPGLTP